MCNAWKLSSNCPYGAQKCRFMHRAFDPQGRPYQLGDIHNRIPQKYRKPPITCEFWYNGNRCTKTPEECQYAHEDTGWTEINGQPIERQHLPPGAVDPAPRDVPPNIIPYKLQTPPITCTFWLRNAHGCSKTDAACKYAHWNTGWATPKGRPLDPPVPLDPNQMPRSQRDQLPLQPNQRSLPHDITCRFWLRGSHGCSKSEEDCSFLHRNTGWIIPRVPGSKSTGKLERIDPSEEPVYRRYGKCPLTNQCLLS